ncbi:MAG TPA: acyl-CoA dehydrogenase family protein [Pseudonocardia sp.]
MPTPVEELFAAPPEVAGHPAVRAAARIGAELLEPHASRADEPEHGVRRDHLRALAEAGLYSVRVPPDLGGYGAGERVAAEVVELLAASCAATWFVLTQHDTASGLVRDPAAGYPPGSTRAGAGAERFREPVSSGAALTGIAIAHLRRPGPPAIRAEPDGRGGYRLTGRADWCTGWGLVDLVLVASATPDERFVLALVPATDQPGLRGGDPLPLAVMGGTRTVALALDGFPVVAEDVLVDVAASAWAEVDARRTANVRPASLGLLRRVLVELEAVGVRRDRPAATRLAVRLAERAAPLRSRAYRLLTEVPAGEALAERVELRGRLAELTVRATQALIAARAGSALLLANPEQRWAREASFHLIQAQPETVRSAQLIAFEHPEWFGSPV